LANTITAVALLVTALTGFISAAGVLVVSRRTKDIGATVAKVADEVTTLNGSTLAMLGDAGETRRIDAIPTGDRTAAEIEHVATVPDPPPRP